MLGLVIISHYLGIFFCSFTFVESPACVSGHSRFETYQSNLIDRLCSCDLYKSARASLCLFMLLSRLKPQFLYTQLIVSCTPTQCYKHKHNSVNPQSATNPQPAYRTFGLGPRPKPPTDTHVTYIGTQSNICLDLNHQLVYTVPTYVHNLAHASTQHRSLRRRNKYTESRGTMYRGTTSTTDEVMHQDKSGSLISYHSICSEIVE